MTSEIKGKERATMGSEAVKPKPAVGQKWKLGRNCEGHHAGDVVTVAELGAFGSFEECRRAHPDKLVKHGVALFLKRCFADATYLGGPPSPSGGPAVTLLPDQVMPATAEPTARDDSGNRPTKPAQFAAPRIPPQPSARSVIEARKKEKPEPWVESCDPLHWIPDA